MKSREGPLSTSILNYFQAFFPSFSAADSKLGRHAAGTAYNIQGSTIQVVEKCCCCSCLSKLIMPNYSMNSNSDCSVV